LNSNVKTLEQRRGADTRLLADILRVRPQAARIALHTEKVVQMRGGFLLKEDVFNLARQIDAACDEIVGALPEVFPQCDCDICREKGDA